MKKSRILFKMLTVLYILTIFSLSASASEGVSVGDAFDAASGVSDDVDGFIEDFRDLLPEELAGLADTDGLLDAVGVEAVLGELAAAIGNERGSIAAFFLLLVGAAVLSSAPTLLPTRTSATAESAISVITSLAVFIAMIPPFAAALSATREAGRFFALLIPVMTGVTVAGGGVGTAEVQAAGMSVTASLLGGGLGALLIEVASFGFAIALLSSTGDSATAAISRGTRNLFAWLLGILTTLTVATLSLQTVVASAADSAAMRAARYAAQSGIPVVGGTVAGALSTLASGLSYARGVIGGGAVAVLLLTLLSPLALMLIYRFALSLATTLSDFFDARVAARSFGAFRYAADSVIAVYASSGVIYVFEIILFLRSGVAIG